MRVLKGVLLLALIVIFSGCWWIWEDTPYEVTVVIVTPSTVYYDTLLNEFYGTDMFRTDTAQIMVKVYHLGEFTVRVLDYVGALSRVDGGYFGDIPLLGLLDSIPQDTTLTCYIEESGKVLDSCLLPIERFLFPVILSKVTTPSSLIYDTLYHKIYNPDTTRFDSLIISFTTRLDTVFLCETYADTFDCIGGDKQYTCTLTANQFIDTSQPIRSDIVRALLYVDTVVVDTVKVPVSFGAPVLWGFEVSEDILLYDTTLLRYFDPDSGTVDSVQFSVKGTPQGSLSLSINGLSTPLVSSGSSHTVMVALADVFGLVAMTTTKTAYLMDSGDTLDELLIMAYPSDSKILEEPFLKYAWHIGYGEACYMEEWHIDKNSSINLYAAWQTTRGSGVTVAIIDDGFDVTHEDLAGNVIDTYNAMDEGTNVEGDYGGAWHGTAVTGFIGAPINNTGIAGVSPDVSLVIIKDGYTDAHTIRAFQYAKNSGAQVVNCSWGTYKVSDAVSDAIQELYDAGITVVFASGNSGRSLDDAGINDESELPTVLGIGASNEDNDVWNYSNYGNNLEAIAPGEAVLGLNKMGPGGSYSQRNVVNQNYFFGSGTSYSCPIVSGVTALLYAIKPTLTPAQVRTIIIETAEKVGGADANYIGGFDEKRLYGKIDAKGAVQRALTY